MERRIEATDSPRRAIYIGNLLPGMFQRTRESQLEFFDWGVRLQTRTLFGRLGGCYEIRYEELAEAALVGKMVRRAIRFRAEFLSQPLIFLTADSREILDRLEQRGVTVNRNVTSLLPRGFLIFWFSTTVPLFLLVVVTEVVPTLIGAQENFHTLRSDLAQVHLPSGYRLTAVRKAGTDCHDWCSLTQTWTWAPGRGRTPSGACSDVNHAMTSAFSDVEPNSPIPATAACDYYTILDSLFHPGQGKRSVDAIVQTGKAHTSGGFVVKLVASYG